MNVQNIPRKDKVVKRAFLPKLDALMYFDFKQIEPRLLAYYLSQTPAVADDRMAASIRAGVDPYTAIVAPMYDKEPDELTDEERQDGKRLFLSLQYGGGVKTVIAQWGVDYHDAKRMVDNFHATWPGVRRLNDCINATVAERGYALSLAGRHLRPDSEHKAVNSICQGSAAEIMRMAMLKVRRFLDEGMMASHLVLTIHDELDLDCIEAEVPLLAREIPRLMNYEPVNAVVPIEVDVEITRTTWADKTTYEEAV